MQAAPQRAPATKKQSGLFRYRIYPVVAQIRCTGIGLNNAWLLKSKRELGKGLFACLYAKQQ